MEEASKITVSVHFYNLLGFKDIEVSPDERVSLLCNYFSDVDFYIHGERVDNRRTFRECGVETGMRIQTYKRGKSMYSYDINFKFLDGNQIMLHVQHAWTFRRAAVELSKLTGLDSDLMRFIFAGRSLNMDYAFMNDSCMQKESTIFVMINPVKAA